MKNANMPDNVKKYFESGRKRIVKVTPNDDYSLTITFDNGELKVYDMTAKLFGVFEVLKDKAVFNDVFIDEAGNIAWDKDKNVNSKIIWNNRIDICADAAYLDATYKKAGERSPASDPL